MLIDAHVHYMPPSLAADLDAFIQAEPFWGLMLAPDAGGKSLQGWAKAERMIADMDVAGIDRVVLMGEYRRSHEGCVARNDQALEIIRRWPDRVSAFAVIQPKAGQAALDELARCLDGGMAGVGELGPYGQGYRLDDPNFLRLAEACILRGIPLNLHTNEEVGHYYPGKATTPLRDYYQLASRYPELKLILAHWGGGLFFYELMPETRRTLAQRVVRHRRLTAALPDARHLRRGAALRRSPQAAVRVGLPAAALSPPTARARLPSLPGGDRRARSPGRCAGRHFGRQRGQVAGPGRDEARHRMVCAEGKRAS